MSWLRCFVVLHLAAALSPVFAGSSQIKTANSEFPGWPQQFEGQQLQQLKLSKVEQRFSRGFPGKIGRFTDGKREIVMRWIRAPSRKLHPALDCFRGSGYSVKPAALRVDSSGHRWGCFTAQKDGEKLKVCEQITDPDSQSWSDTSSWFWSAIFRKTHGPWWAVTTAETTAVPHRGHQLQT